MCMCCPNYLGDLDREVTGAQEFEVNLGNMTKPHFKKKKKKKTTKQTKNKRV